MAVDDPQQASSRPGAVYLVAIVLLVAVIAITAATLWQVDNSGTNSLSGDPQSTSPPSSQTAP
jgi:hypothetical protein